MKVTCSTVQVMISTWDICLYSAINLLSADPAILMSSLWFWNKMVLSQFIDGSNLVHLPLAHLTSLSGRIQLNLISQDLHRWEWNRGQRRRQTPELCAASPSSEIWWEGEIRVFCHQLNVRCTSPRRVRPSHSPIQSNPIQSNPGEGMKYEKCRHTNQVTVSLDQVS